MAILLSSNITAANIGGILSVNTNPLINTATYAMTGLSCNLTANAQTNGNLAQTNTLSCKFNETGMYEIQGMLFFGHHNTGGNAANVGMNVGFGNSGTATISTIKYVMIGRANGTTITTNLITTTAQSVVIPNTTGSLANSTNNSDYLLINGYLNVSAVGTVNIQIASANSVNANLNVSSNSFVLYTKIG